MGQPEPPSEYRLWSQPDDIAVMGHEAGDNWDALGIFADDDSSFTLPQLHDATASRCHSSSDLATSELYAADRKCGSESLAWHTHRHSDGRVKHLRQLSQWILAGTTIVSHRRLVYRRSANQIPITSSIFPGVPLHARHQSAGTQRRYRL